MKSITKYCLLITLFVTVTSCSKYLQTGNGGFSDVSLNRNSDEYTIKRLNPIELNGNAICGIPGLGGKNDNNKNKNKTGIMFRFNGVQIGRVSRIIPILTMIGFTFGYAELAQKAVGYKKSYPFDYKLNNGIQYLVALPFAGVSNNLLWNGVAASGLTNQINYQLIEDNPGIDVFVNPKYKIDYKLGIFTQKATVKADVTGATLKMK